MILLGAAAPIGLLTGFLAWSAAGGASASLDRIAPVASQLAALRPSAGTKPRQTAQGERLLATPIFALTVGPGAVREPAIRVDGLSVSRRRAAALVSIDGASAQWMTVGETRDGVTLRTVSASKAVFDTPIGDKELGLGEQSASSAPAAPPADSTEAASTIVDRIPPGFRSPPPPASAKEQP